MLETEIKEIEQEIKDLCKREPDRNIIDQNKFKIEDNVNNLSYISDAIARVCNSLCKTHAAAVNLIFEEKLFIKFATKCKANNYRDSIDRIIKSMAHQSSKFILHDNFNKMKKFAFDFRNMFINENESVESIRKVNDLLYSFLDLPQDPPEYCDDCDVYFQSYKSFIHSITDEQIETLRDDKSLYSQSQFIRIIISDIIFLKTIFCSDNNFNVSNAVIQYIEPPVSNTAHPDTNLAYYLFKNGLNTKYNYIGVSHLCCIYCTLFLDSYGFLFKGTSKKLETWKFPYVEIKNESKNRKKEILELIKVQHDKFKENFDLFLEWSRSVNRSDLYSTYFTGRLRSKCQNSSEIMSNDICEYYEFNSNNIEIKRLYDTEMCECKTQENKEN
jgi:hypothetical protein